RNFQVRSRLYRRPGFRHPPRGYEEAAAGHEGKGIYAEKTWTGWWNARLSGSFGRELHRRHSRRWRSRGKRDENVPFSGVSRFPAPYQPGRQTSPPWAYRASSVASCAALKPVAKVLLLLAACRAVVKASS